MKIQSRKNSLLYTVLTILRTIIGIAALTLIGCGGGFNDDNENANEFKNPIFHPEKVEIDTINIDEKN